MMMRSCRLLAMLVVLGCCTCWGVARAATLTVRQAGGYGYYASINAALAAAAAGDTILIADSADYYEQVVLNKPNLQLRAAEGEWPHICGQNVNAAQAVVYLSQPGITLYGIGIYTAGCAYALSVEQPGATIQGCKFDVTVAARGSSTFCTWQGATGGTTLYSDCTFYGYTNVTAGGILTYGATNFTVQYCYFWGLGGIGGMIGIEAGPQPTLTVNYNYFACPTLNTSIIGINAWNGTLAISETNNTFFNLNTRMAGAVNGGVLNSSSWGGSGTCAPTDTAQGMTMNNVDTLLSFYGTPLLSESSLAAYQGPATLPLGTYLNKMVRWHYWRKYYDDWDPTLGKGFGQHAKEFMQYTNAQHWEAMEPTWYAQYDAAIWERMRVLTADYRATVNPNMLMGGFVMEAIQKTPFENTPIPNRLYLWMLRQFRPYPIRPIEVKTVNGRKIPAAFFDFDVAHYGWSDTFWDASLGDLNSVPNLQRQEGMMYYLYCIKSMIDAGINEIEFAQPQLTFCKEVNNTAGNVPMRVVCKFAKNYGASWAPLMNGKRFVVVAADSILFSNFKSACTLVDYAHLPAGVYANGAGHTWLSLNDAYTYVPAASLGLSGKPISLFIDNFGNANDHISVIARATPADRNAWLPAWRGWVASTYGYYVTMPGLTQITPTYSQNTTGYTAIPNTWPNAWHFCPWDEYGGMESLIRNLFL